MGIDWNAVEGELAELFAGLPGLSVDRERIERFAADVVSGRLSADSNRLREPPEPPLDGDVDDLDALPAAERDRLEAEGRGAIGRGEVAVAVLNGGMATRFGGVVKGIIEAVGGRTFLEIKLAQARSLGPAPLLIMNSFATHAGTEQFLAERGLSDGIHSFLQNVSLRLTPDGQLFRTAEGALSPYAPGHGDFPEAMRRSGLLSRLEASGVRAVMLSNVDNLGADLDPAIVGYHLAHGRPVTIETAAALPGDVGGAPARVDGHLQVVEGFRFPRGYDFSRLRYSNTNTFLFSLEGLKVDHPLHWFYVEKEVEGEIAVQFERLVGEISAFVDAAFLATPRGGAAGRFFPIKNREALERLRADPVLVERFTRV